MSLGPSIELVRRRGVGASSPWQEGGGPVPSSAESSAEEDIERGSADRSLAMSNVATSAVLMAAGVNPMFSRKPFSGEKTDGAVTKVGMTAVDGLALAGVGTSAATLALTGGPVAAVASYCTIGFSPFLAYQKRKLKGLGGFRGQHMALRGKVNELSVENSKLSSGIDKLEENVSKIEAIEKDLAELADTTNTTRLVQLIKEQGEINRKMKEHLKDQVVFNVIDVIIKSDQNRDFMIGPHELKLLILRLKHIQGVDFREDNFRELLGHKKKYTLANIMDLMRNLLDDEVPEEENVFDLHPEEVEMR